MLFETIGGVFLYLNILENNHINNIARASYSDYWYNTAFLYRKQITIDHTTIQHTDSNNANLYLSNFPVLVSVNIPTNQVRSDYNDIVFTNQSGTQLLSYDIESYDASGNLVAWVKIPQLNDANNTVNTSFYMYYDNSTYTNTTSNTSSNTWDGDFKAVYHLKEIGDNSAVYDATQYANNSTSQTWTPTTSGQIDGAGSFNGSSSYIQKQNPNGLPAGAGARTISAWVNPSSFASTRIVASYGTGLNLQTFTLGISSTGKISLFGNGTGDVISGTVADLNTWQQVVAVYDGTNIVLYKNGTSINITAKALNTVMNSSGFVIGESPGLTMPFAGSIDEVRISNIARSADWIKVEYNNQHLPNAFYNLGSEESYTNYSASSSPIIAEVTTVSSPTNNITPSYTFASSRSGTIAYGGGCSSPTTSAVVGNNTVTFRALSQGVHSDCTIRVTDSLSNQSNLLNVTSFTIDTSAPTSGLVAYSDGYNTTARIPLTVADGTDSVSGIDVSSRIIQTRSAVLSNGVCGSYGSYSTVHPAGAYPNFTHVVVSSGICYQYRYLISDNVGNQAIYTSSNTVKVDRTMPLGGHLTYADGYHNSPFISLIANDGTDSVSGIDDSSRIIRRRSAVLSSGTCGNYGIFSTISPTGSYPNYTDPTVSSGDCYQYQYQVSDNAGNQTTYTATSIKTDTDSDFTIVLFPDTQMEVQDHPQIWESMNQWVADNKASNNIQAVIGLGDVTNSPTTTQFAEAQKGYNIIDAANIPYIPIVGNHDYTNISTRNATNWNNYFGVSRFSGKSWYGGAYNNSTTNWWIKFDVGTHKYLVLGLEFFPQTTDITWAQGVINANLDREVILATHAYLDNNGSRVLHGDLIGDMPSDNDARQLWDNFIKVNPNIFLVVGGHYTCSPTSVYAKDVGIAGNTVDQLFVNHQCDANGGNGYMELLRFRPSLGTIDAITYSPTLDATDSTGAYSMPYNVSLNTIKIDTTVPVSFAPISPDNGAVISDRNPVFFWNASSDTESNLSKYQLYIDGVMDKDNISNSSTSSSPSSELFCGNHSWYIKAIDNNNNTTDSNTFTLDINCAGGFIPPTKPIVTPTDPALGTVPSNITQIAISRTPDFTNISWQPFDKDKFKNIDQTTETLYVKFRTDQGAVSDTIIYEAKPSIINSNLTIIPLIEGDIVKTPNNPDVYVIKYKNNKKYKRLILSPLVFKSYQHLKWENIKIISQEQLDKYTTSNLVKETIDTIIYQLFPNGDIGERKAQDTSINYDSDSVYEINKTDRDSYVLVK